MIKTTNKGINMLRQQCYPSSHNTKLMNCEQVWNFSRQLALKKLNLKIIKHEKSSIKRIWYDLSMFVWYIKPREILITKGNK